LLLSALDLPDLSESTRAAVSDLQTTFTEGIDYRNAELRRITMDYEPRSFRVQYEQVLKTGDNEMDLGTDPVRLAFDKRTEFEDQTAAQLRNLLTPEQVNSLPGLRLAGGASDASIMTQFDRNGDGKLDAEEREALREYFRNQGR
jgi:hypothetical protein